MRRLALLSALLFLLCLAAPAQSLPVVGPPPPETTIAGGPEEGAVVEGDVEFAFEASRDGATLAEVVFHCSIDGAAPTPCSSPVAYEELGEGPHTFSVAAEDARTRAVDPEPATRSFAIGEAGCDEEATDGEEEAEESEGEESDGGEACEAADASGLPPRECLLRSARAGVVAGGEKARLTLRYTTFAPTDALISLRTGGAKGSLRIGTTRRRLGLRGVVRLGERLGKGEAARVRAARRLTVEIEVPGTPEECHRYGIRRLTVKRSAPNRQTWLQSDPAFGPAA